MIVEVLKQRWRRPTLVAMAGVGVMAAIGLMLWSVPPAISNISSRRYADAVEVGTRVVLVVVAVVLVGAALDRARRRWWWWAAAALGVLIGLTAVVLLVWLAPPALYKNITPKKDRANPEATTRTGLIAGLAGLAALGGLAMAARTYRLTEQGQITDRYTKAIEQLGDDKLDIRLGGIYALERIAGDSKRDHSTVVEVLSAFIREHSRPTTSRMLLPLERSRMQTGEPPPVRVRQDRAATPKPATDVQATVTVLGRLPSRPGVSRGDLTGARLTGAGLFGANLADADLVGANLTDADLARANLTAVKGLTQQQLDSARGDAQTKLPAGLHRPAHWIAYPDTLSAGDL